MGTQIRQWSTASVDAPQRLAYWVDSICDSFLEMKVSPGPGVDAGFFGAIEHSALAGLGVYQSRGSVQDVARDSTAIARGRGANHYYLITQLGTPWGLRHVGRESTLQPGDTVLVDSREAYDFHFPGGLHNLSVQMPIGWVERWLPEPAALLGRPLSGSAGWGAALRAFKEALTPAFAADPELPPALLQDHLGALMSLAYGTLPAAPRSLRAPYQRCLSTMRERLGEAGLLAQDVARQGAMSLRTLHRAFAAEGHTFAGVLRELRLAEAERMLADRRFARLPVADIGQRCGFAEPSHFARQFRRMRGLSPSAFRARAG